MKHAALFASALFALLGLSTLSVGAQPDRKNYAQQLVDETLAKHPEVIILAMHAKSPTDAEYPIVASNIGRIGKKADEDDMRVINTGKPNLEVNEAGNHFEVELTLQDASRRTIGALGVVFNYKQGDDKAAFQKKAEQVRDELRARIPTEKMLFAPAK
jgi:hypothetical protein